MDLPLSSAFWDLSVLDWAGRSRWGQAILLSLVLSFVAGLARLAPWRCVRWGARVYVEIFRGTSLLVQLF